MKSSAEIIEELKARGVKPADIARVLHVDPSQMSRLYSGKRGLYVDEAKRIMEKFGLQESQAAPAELSAPVARLLTLWLADELGVRLDPESPRVAALAQDLQAFSTFAFEGPGLSNPEAAEGFLRGRRSAVSASQTLERTPSNNQR